MTGAAPKPVSLGLDGPTAQEAKGITIKIARRLSRRMRIPIDERWLMMHGRQQEAGPPRTSHGASRCVIRAEELSLPALRPR